MERMFRLLRANEIEVRVGNVSKAGDRANLLLYKDARCDMRILDETVGPYNWQKRYTRDNANCIISIWDKDKGQWIEKEDTGTESRTEAEKGLASDSAKRAGFVWGIGRELYTAPPIWVPYSEAEKWTSYKVAHIAYDENDCISELVIVKKGQRGRADEEVFRMMGTGKTGAADQNGPIGEKAAKALVTVCTSKGISEEYLLKSCKKDKAAEITGTQKAFVLNHLDDIKEAERKWRQQAG